MKLCDVFPDGTSALVTRGTLDLAYRDGVHGSPSPLVPGEEYDVEIELDACAYQFDARPDAARCPSPAPTGPTRSRPRPR